jgi:hypothetical protein
MPTAALIWRKRASKKLRAAVLATVQAAYPSARDAGDAILLEHDPKDTGPLWFFLAGASKHLKAFSDIRKAPGSPLGSEPPPISVEAGGRA